MVDEDLKRIEEAILTKALGSLLGLRESVVFEAKGRTPYDLATASGQYELAKDVSALANALGGWILIGLTTERTTEEPTDVVSGLDLFPQDDFDIKKIEGILREYVNPRVNGLQVVWIAKDPPDGSGLGVLRIPAQSDEAKPFIIARVVQGDERVKQIVFGYCMRVAADSIPHDATQIRGALKQGMGPTAQRLTAIEQKLSALLESSSKASDQQLPTPSAAEAVAALDERIRRLLGH